MWSQTYWGQENLSPNWENLERNALPVFDDSTVTVHGGQQTLGKIWAHLYLAKEIRCNYAVNWQGTTYGTQVTEDTTARGNVTLNDTADPATAYRDLYEHPTQRHFFGNPPSYSHTDAMHSFSFSYEAVRDQGRTDRANTVDDFQPWTNRAANDYRLAYTLTFTATGGTVQIKSAGESADSHSGTTITGTATIFGETLPMYTYLATDTWTTTTTSLEITVASWLDKSNLQWTDLEKNSTQDWHDGSTL